MLRLLRVTSVFELAPNQKLSRMVRSDWPRMVRSDWRWVEKGDGSFSYPKYKTSHTTFPGDAIFRFRDKKMLGGEG